MGFLSQNRRFLQEFISNYHTTGAILPSGRFLARALARFVGERSGKPRRILEVGPGTGPVTLRIIEAMADEDRLDLVELNDSFVAGLRERFERDPTFHAVADRARVLHCPVQELADGASHDGASHDGAPYDVIISGLPLNNFEPDLVEQILATMTGLLTPGGTLSFFEYIAIRRVKTLVSGRETRTRLQGVARAMSGVLDGHEIRRDAVWPNVPPAWVHHVRFDR